MPNPTGNKYSWLITFLLYDNAWYDKNHEGETGYISLEKQNNILYGMLAKMDIHEKIKIVLLEAKIDLAKKVLEISMRTKIASSSVDPILLKIPELTSAAMSNTESLKELLRPVIEADTADQHMIITVGHGSIFGINLYSEKDDKDNPLLAKSHIELASQKLAFSIGSKLKEYLDESGSHADRLPQEYVGSINIEKQINKLAAGKHPKTVETFELYVPELNLTVLTVKEINDAFLAIFETKPVDIMVLDNCLMQNIFTQFELSEKVNYLVAAESGISFPGFNYKVIIEKLSASIDMDPEALANEFVDEKTIRSHEAYFDNSVKNTIERHWCVNCVALNRNQYAEIKQRFDELFHLLYTLINSQIKKIREEIYHIVRTTNDQLFGYNTYSLPKIKIIDLQVFLIYFKQRVTDNTILENEKGQLLAAIDLLKQAMKNIKVKSFIGNQFYPPRNYYIDEVNRDCIGFGFLLPVKPCGDKLIDLLFVKNGTIVYTPSFLKNSDYFKFIKRFWEMSPPGFI